jgi:hypothetical protein
VGAGRPPASALISPVPIGSTRTGPGCSIQASGVASGIGAEGEQNGTPPVRRARRVDVTPPRTKCHGCPDTAVSPEWSGKRGKGIVNTSSLRFISESVSPDGRWLDPGRRDRRGRRENRGLRRRDHEAPPAPLSPAEAIRRSWDGWGAGGTASWPAYDQQAKRLASDHDLGAWTHAANGAVVSVGDGSRIFKLGV